MRRVTLIALALGLAVLAIGAGAVRAQDAADRNRDVGAAQQLRAERAADRLVDRVLRRSARAARAEEAGELCAIAVVPGPATSFAIRFGLTNVAAAPVDVAIVDSFRALGGRALLHESVFGVTPPADGAVDVLYPAGEPGRGPVVLDFTGFDQLESTAFSTDPDTYDDPAFGATVGDLDETRIELAYEGELRCAGTLRFDAGLNASVALITRTSP